MFDTPIAIVLSLMVFALLLAAILGSMATAVYLLFSLGPVLPQNSEGEPLYEEEGALDYDLGEEIDS